MAISPQLQTLSSQACPSNTRRSPEIRPCRPADLRDTLNAQARRLRLGTQALASPQQAHAWRTASIRTPTAEVPAVVDCCRTAPLFSTRQCRWDPKMDRSTVNLHSESLSCALASKGVAHTCVHLFSLW
ncbi:unnamed protein product, partial [Ectocarpus sp. 12 AP-2014]